MPGTVDTFFDLRMISNLGLRCLDGCGFCCLCKPQLLDGEEENFRSGPFAHLIREENGPDGLTRSFAVQGSYGACSLLDHGKCMVYDERPHMCRQFPVMVYMLGRVQPLPILSCRGLWNQKNVEWLTSFHPSARPEDIRGLVEELSVALVGGRKGLVDTTLAKIFRKEREMYGSKFFEHELERTVKQEAAARKQLGSRGAWIDPDRGRSLLRKLYSGIMDIPFLTRTVDLANSSDLNFVLKKRLDLFDTVASHRPRMDLMEYVRVNEREIFEQDEMYNLPVLSDRDLSWKVFGLLDGMMERSILRENGELEGIDSIPFDAVELLPLDSGAHLLAVSYISYFMELDFTWGVITMIAAEEQYRLHTLNAAVQFLGSIAADLLWRASMLALFSKKRSIDALTMMDAIVFTDMDLLDSWSLGEIV